MLVDKPAFHSKSLGLTKPSCFKYWNPENNGNDDRAAIKSIGLNLITVLVNKIYIPRA